MASKTPFLDAQPSLDVSVIISSRNRADSLLQVIQSLYDQKGLQEVTWEVLAVDNGSEDATRATIEEFIAAGHPETRYLFEPAIGQSHAKNLGVIHSRGGILVFTDDDVILDQHWLVSMLFAFRKFGCMGAGGKMIPIFSPAPPDWYRGDFPFPYRFDFGDQTQSLSAPPFGANMAFRREAFERYGLFRTDLGASRDNPAGKGEDSEFGRRLLDGGDAIMYVPDALLYHPLDANLITRDFMHQWHYQYGRSQAIRDPGLCNGIKYFGIPRHLIRSLIASTISGLLSSDPVTRFQCEMERHRIRGIIAEQRAIARRSHSGVSPG